LTHSIFTASETLKELKAGHDRFVKAISKHPHSSQQRLNRLATGQHPMAMVLSCSDSRVPIELLFDVGFGDLFVIRNAGNACTEGSLASIEYGLEGLNINLLVVLGHEGCGAVAAACADHVSLSPSLSQLVLHIRQGLVKGAVPLDPDLAVRRHPVLTAQQLIGSSQLVQDRVNSGALVIEPACYTFDHGKIEWMGSTSTA
jgi:carbonic anhydrase